MASWPGGMASWPGPFAAEYLPCDLTPPPRPADTTLYVPYTKLGQATRAFVTSPLSCPVRAVLVDVSDAATGYLDYMQKAWSLGRDFINLEHDIVPWPGAIQALLECPEPWCFYGYDHGVDFVRSSCPVLGLTRFRAGFVKRFPRLWANYDPPHPEHPWRGLDVHLMRYTAPLGITAHQHTPSVFNANPGLLDPRAGLDLPKHRTVHDFVKEG